MGVVERRRVTLVDVAVFLIRRLAEAWKVRLTLCTTPKLDHHAKWGMKPQPTPEAYLLPRRRSTERVSSFSLFFSLSQSNLPRARA